jgi:hypothetical protein
VSISWGLDGEEGLVGWVCPENQEWLGEEEGKRKERKNKREIILKNMNILLQ